MVITDLDGTLIRSDRTFANADLNTLVALGREGVVRVVATGRSLYSARMVLEPEFPIDYLIFSTGAGIFDWPQQRLLRKNALGASDVESAARVLASMDLPFMVHAAVPENHRFVYRRAPSGRVRGDFELRLERYLQYAAEWVEGAAPPLDAAQFVAITDAEDVHAYDELRRALPMLEVVRATSPLDGRSRWLEIFPSGVSKSHASNWLAERCGVSAEQTLGVGNDYNDEDLLAWAGVAFVVANAPDDLLNRHSSVPSNDDGGFSAAVDQWRRIIR